MKRQGKIRAFGASVESIEEALWCLQQEGLGSLQIIFNIFRQSRSDVFLDKAKAQGAAIIVRLPLASGLFAGKITRHTVFAPTDHRSFNRDGQEFNVGETFAGLPLEKGIELVGMLKGLAPAGMTMAQFALRWCLDFDAVTTVIPGDRRRTRPARTPRPRTFPRSRRHCTSSSGVLSSEDRLAHPRKVLRFFMGKRDRQDEGLPEIPLVGDLTENESDWSEKLLSVEPGGECILYFDSMGGCPYAAIALMSLILFRGLKATGVVAGECSSAALWPFAACRRRLVSPLSVLACSTA